MQDRYGNALTTQSQVALDHYAKGVDLFLAAGFGGVQAFEAAVQADDQFALGYVALARTLQMAMDMSGAKAALQKARALKGGLSDRELSHLACFEALLSGEAGRCRALCRMHVIRYPRDALVAQLCAGVFSLIGFSGEVGREAEMLAYTTQLMPHYQGDWWMMSMHALALCETGQTQASEDLMDASLALNPTNAQGAHFKAHAMYESNQTEAGRAFLSTWMRSYDKRAVLHSHLRWHEALWALHAGDMPSMWAAVDDGVGPDASLGLPLNILTDTAAIYYRAELAGETIPSTRWAALSDYAATYFPNAGQSFADMHAALAHAMAGDGDRLSRLSETTTGFAADLVRPVSEAWGAMARQDWLGALDALTPVMAVTERIGGSRAQRDLLELSFANVLMKLGRSEEAKRTLAMRRPILAQNVPLDI